MSQLDKVKWIDLVSKVDTRGILTAVESERDIPFPVKRIFYMHHITTDRGGHAHRETDQLVIAVAGSFKLEIFDGTGKETYIMDDPRRGLYIPRMVFIQVKGCSPDAVCLVLASTYYDIKKSIRTQEEYLEAVKGIE